MKSVFKEIHLKKFKGTFPSTILKYKRSSFNNVFRKFYNFLKYSKEKNRLQTFGYFVNGQWGIESNNKSVVRAEARIQSNSVREGMRLAVR